MSGVSILTQYPNVFAKQSYKGCLRSMLGCDAKTEFTMATMENKDLDVFYAKEESGCFCRTFFQSIHPFVMNISQGGLEGGAPVAAVERPLACHANNCKCCCFQRVDVRDGATNQAVGTFEETFYMCIPTYTVKTAQGAVTHRVHMPICMGCLPNICAEGCCRVPFYVFAEGADESQPPAGKIVRVWGSLGSELLGVHRFQCEFPNGASAETKATLMGGMLLLNELYFKKGGNE